MLLEDTWEDNTLHLHGTMYTCITLSKPFPHDVSHFPYPSRARYEVPRARVSAPAPAKHGRERRSAAHRDFKKRRPVRFVPVRQFQQP
jgi:hypothetical protein